MPEEADKNVDPVTLRVDVIDKLFSAALEPDTMIFFQFGILHSITVGYWIMPAHFPIRANNLI